MAERQVVENITRLDPKIEAYKLGLLKDTQALVDNPLYVAPHQVAGLSPQERQAMRLASQGVGSYRQYLQNGRSQLSSANNSLRSLNNNIRDMTQTADNAVQQVRPMTGQLMQLSNQGQSQYQPNLNRAQNMFGQARGNYNDAAQYGDRLGQYGMNVARGSGDMYDTDITKRFMDPYRNAVIKNTMNDMNRQGAISLNAVRGDQVAKGAFGGSRGAVADIEHMDMVDRNINNTVAQLRDQNYSQAQAAGMTAFEQAQQRQQQGQQMGLASLQNAGMLQAQAGQGLAQIGGMYADIANQGANIGLQGAANAGGIMNSATGLQLQGYQAAGQLRGQQAEAYNNLGTAYANMGALGQTLNQNDARLLATMGGVARQQNQMVLDANRQTIMDREMAPYQQLAFMSNIYSGVPAAQSSMQVSSNPSASPWAQAIGAGIQGYSLYNAYNNYMRQ